MSSHKEGVFLVIYFYFENTTTKSIKIIFKKNYLNKKVVIRFLTFNK